jgi:hypothetical protein
MHGRSSHSLLSSLPTDALKHNNGYAAVQRNGGRDRNHCVCKCDNDSVTLTSPSRIRRKLPRESGLKVL